MSTSHLSTEACIQHIEHYSTALAQAARGHLDARVEHCPGWDVADLVWHVTEVHWFWRTIADELLAEPPDESRRPTRPADAALVDAFESGMSDLASVLRKADQSASCWTWFPPQQDVAFITRHQVQEAAVHAWDAVHAADGALEIEASAAADAVDEFLTVSLADDEDARDNTLPTFDASISFRASDTGDSWTVSDGSLPGSLTMRRGVDAGNPVIEATAADLLLWLYRRADVVSQVPGDVVDRFRQLSSTD